MKHQPIEWKTENESTIKEFLAVAGIFLLGVGILFL